MFAIFNRRHPYRPPADAAPAISGRRPGAVGRHGSDPQDHVALVSRTVESLEELRELVLELPELPADNRSDLLQQLASTSASLRSLCFLDAVY